jgi:hypothetical protein
MPMSLSSRAAFLLWGCRFFLVVATRCATAGSAEILAQPDPLSLGWLSVPDATKALLRSGYDFEDGNVDSGNFLRVEPEGRGFEMPDTAWVLFEARGPGVITSFWFTGKNRKGQASIGGRLNLFFDGEEKPSVSGPLPELIESGALFPKRLAERSSGGWVGYAPIFFARQLKVTLTEAAGSFTVRTNAKGRPIPHLYHQFSYQLLKSPVRSSTPESLRATPAWARPKVGEIASQTVELPANENRAIASITGKGIVQALRLRFLYGDPAAATLRVSVDGETQVQMRVTDFWGFDPKARPSARLDSLLMAVEADGTFASFWPMPHRDRFEVELQSSGPRMQVRVEVAEVPGWPEPEHLHFHAGRVTDITERGRDIKLLNVSGRGHFAGAILELANGTLEGDDRFYVDGESFPPAWHGTGTEDYFRCGWYFFGGTLTRPLYGLLDNASPKLAYRFQLADRINFSKSLVVGFEHGHHNQYLGPYRGTVFWYGEGMENKP